jgi:uncharacterized protein (TIGR03437 family)
MKMRQPYRTRKTLGVYALGLLALLVIASHPAFPQDKDECRASPQRQRQQRAAWQKSDCVSSQYAPPEANETTFVVDCGGGLDTGCVFKKDVANGELIIHLPVTRHIGDVVKLKANGLVPPTVLLEMPAFDVDYYGGDNENRPERDRVFFNGREVPGVYLTGENNQWKLNQFRIPIEWIDFPIDPGENGRLQPRDNTIRIQIDTANPGKDVWCTAIDWVSLKIEAPRPVLFVHGILSDGFGWNDPPFRWASQLTTVLGIPNNGTELSMGYLPDLIQTNARKVGDAVASARARWGVDRINLICHSKGGLDSRHFVENNDDVDQVIQIGTPNAGSPLADFIIRSSLRLPPLGALAVNLLGLATAPGGYQLTTYHMAGYNAFHRYNPKVRYSALAGHYRVPCSSFFCYTGQFFIDRFYGGPNDLVVPVSSVYALRSPSLLTFAPPPESGSEALHTELNNSRQVFDLLANRIKEAIPPDQPLLATGENALEGQLTATAIESAETQAPFFNANASAAGAIRQGQTQIHTLAVDQATFTSFTLLHPSGNLDLALVSPSGQRLSPGTIGGNPNVVRHEQDIPGGRMEVYFLNQPEVGLWRAEVSAPSVVEPGGESAYAVGVWMESAGITFTGSATRANIRAGETLQLTGALRNNNSPLTGASVAAKIKLPDNTAVDVALRDDGTNGDATANDGIYTANFANTTQAGNYQVLFTAGRAAVSGTPAFNREDFILTTVSRSRSTFTGTYRDRGIDDDGDSLFNRLRIEADLDLTAAGSYRVLGVLTDSRGNRYEAADEGTVGAGRAVAFFDFDGEAIFKNGVDGPYRLSLVRLAEEDGTAIMPVDERANVYQTRAYRFREFQRAPVRLTGQGAARGVDTNQNGRFDFLDVDLEVDVLTGGRYDWSAQLVDRNNKEIDFTIGAKTLTSGFNTITLRFRGEEIWRNAVDGPYSVHGLIFAGEAGSLVSSNAFTTGALRFSQFEASGRVVNVSAASYSGTALASESIVAAFGSSFATEVRSATSLPLPTSLAGTSVKVKDSAGVERLAPLFFVSRGQVNYQVPSGTANGAATVTVTSNQNAVSEGTIRISSVAPGIFTANASGLGVAAATVLRVTADGSQVFEPVARFDQQQGQFVALPIDLGPSTDQVFLILFGTGLRFRSNLSAVTARIGGENAQALFAGPAPGFAGLDQINLRIPRSLAGRGEVDVTITADGASANVVKVAFGRQGNLAITFDPNPARPNTKPECNGTNYDFTIIIRETNGVGVAITRLDVDQFQNLALSEVGFPSRINANGEFRGSIKYCRSPGASVWTITGRDDNGSVKSWSGTIQLQSP